MRAIFVAAPVILFLGVYQAARGEPANVGGGVSCPENGIGAFGIQIVGEIDSTTVDKVSRLFDELHEVDANGGVAIRPRPGRPSGPSVLQRRFGEVPQWGKSGGDSVKCPVFGVGYEINSPGGSVSVSAVKDDDTLVDAIVERLYRKMKELDLERAEDAVELIVDRDVAAGSRFRALLNDLWPDKRAQFAAS
jgi:hypothetical protein